ncbi:MAG: family N-acetyltransferase [Anaerosolibacter sp.]|jgi:GNAT superfamily N-acetyltransferase|uniref:GNAT family N-acetyltransferase n=1 Tax=Anaerosolibacter sp. TaxID=1872527 RepID=UPI00260449D6|nr:GNAT family N-acetyltransferase [Anaerosolibacter sp.]MDF2548931.1 family N-acetyltransferase [Anaerosolibacter sp.]
MLLYSIKSGREAMQIDDIKKLLEQTYWADKRDIGIIKKSIDNSLCYGAFLKEGGKQIGFSRVITDYATTYYICDVIVDEQHRGLGIGKTMLDAIHDNKEVSSLRGILVTRDAHDFYRKYGFQEGGNLYMGKAREEVSESSVLKVKVDE